MVKKVTRPLFSSQDFISFSYRLIAQLEQIGKYRTAERYNVTLHRFARYGSRPPLSSQRMDAHLMMGYEVYLQEAGICPNTTSYYMRNLRAMYNRAVEQGLTVQQFPFKHVYTGVDKTVKRAVSLPVIRQIRDLDLSSLPSMDWARDMFLFSFYTRGMSFIDMALLKKKDLRKGVLVYRRQKTGQQLVVRWEAPMQAIIDKYDTSDTPYLLPIIRDKEKEERRQYINSSHLINKKLKIIGERIGLTIPLTMYVARHGWVSIAQSKQIPVATISEALGHDSESTTRIYLASLETSVIDKANSLILNSL